MGCLKQINYLTESKPTLKVVWNRSNFEHPFGMLMPGRYMSTGAYRYGYQGSEKDDAIKGGGNSYSTHFRLLDVRLGRWLSIDPKASTWESPYVSMGNSPILNNDVLGDTIRGTSKTSGVRLRDEVKNSFSGVNAEKFRNLITLGSDGKTLSPIDEATFVKSVQGMSDEQKKLAYSYMVSINSSNIHLVEMVKRSENLGPLAAGIFHKTTGAEADDSYFGGVNTGLASNSTISIVVMDSKASILDFQKEGGGYESRISGPGELIAHEVLGHGAGRVAQTAGFMQKDAIQMTNLYLRAQGIGTIFRDGTFHGRTIPLSKTTATAIPLIFNISFNLHHKLKLDLPNVTPALRDQTNLDR